MPRKTNRAEAQLIHQIADEMEPAFADQFVAAILAVRGKIDLNDLLDAIRLGDPEAVQDLLRDLPAGMQPAIDVFGQTLERAALAYAVPTAAILGGQIQFDMINPRVVAWMRENSAALVTNISAETQAAIQAVLGQAAEEGVPMLDVAELLQDVIGLDARRASALYNYWQGLQEQGVDPESIDGLVNVYSSRLLQDRAETIARTEIVHAANEGTQQMWYQAVDDGLINPEKVKQEWIATAGACEVCESIDGQQVGLDEPFVDSEGEEYDQPPAHPNCRCTIGLAVE